jgi:hypothetical protein
MSLTARFIPAVLALTALAAVESRAQARAQRSAEAQAGAPRRLSFDLAAGVMRYGPHARAGVELAGRAWPVAFRLDGLFGPAPAHEVPGGAFVSATAGVVVPIRPEARLSPYLLGGAGVSLSRHLAPRLGLAGGAGMRLRLGRLTAFADARVQPRAGVPLSIGVRF